MDYFPMHVTLWLTFHGCSHRFDMAAKFVQPLKSIFGGIQSVASRLAGGDSYNVEEVEKDSQATLTTTQPKPTSSSEDIPADEAECEAEEVPSLRGTLLKWTNYLQGWQERYFVLGNGILTYYRSESDAQCGCRGSINLEKAKILVSSVQVGSINAAPAC